MVQSNLHIRRATVDDREALKMLWAATGLSPEQLDELEKRLTEFQVVESNGQVLGAIGIQIIGQHALLYCEDYTDYSITDAARELFLERIQTIAANHGVFRLWTQERSPFWTRSGFQPANAEMLARLPANWNQIEGQWLTLQLKDEEAISTALGENFAGFMDAEKKQTARVAAKAKTFRTIITVLGFTTFFICIAIAIYLFMHHRNAGAGI
ncbi:MAG: hypothetical protein WDM76_05665 [Limisphaerales bacterium]